MAEHRAAEAVKQWHSTGSDSTPKSISYDNVIPFAEPISRSTHDLGTLFQYF